MYRDLFTRSESGMQAACVCVMHGICTENRMLESGHVNARKATLDFFVCIQSTLQGPLAKVYPRRTPLATSIGVIASASDGQTMIRGRR
ncbi:hypothetical protein ACU8KH_01460 [Lachancea thermotolerans]